MAAHEWIAAAYFAAFVLVAWTIPVRFGRRILASGASAGVVLLVALSPTLSPVVRAWMPHVYLLAGYWMPSLLVGSPRSRWFEDWLAASDERLRPVLPDISEPLRHFVELAYLLCYPMIPISFAIVWTNGGSDDVQRFWVSVLLAGYTCYVTLPWLVSRPPRLRLERVSRTRLAGVNAFVLGRVSHQLITFPSGHVAVAAAAAASVAAVSAPVGAVTWALVAAISVGAVAGGYHYVIDVLSGLLVAAGAVLVAMAV